MLTPRHQKSAVPITISTRQLPVIENITESLSRKISDILKQAIIDDRLQHHVAPRLARSKTCRASICSKHSMIKRRHFIGLELSYRACGVRNKLARHAKGASQMQIIEFAQADEGKYLKLAAAAVSQTMIRHIFWRKFETDCSKPKWSSRVIGTILYKNMNAFFMT